MSLLARSQLLIIYLWVMTQHYLSLTCLWNRFVLDSWVVSQIWLDSDSNESSQSRVGRENQEYESSQSRVTLIVIWVRVESTRYCLSQSWVNDFSRRKRQDLAVICNFTEKEPTYSYIRPHPPPGQQLFPKLGQMWWVVSQIWLNWLKWVESELSQVSKFGFWVESELSQVSKFGIWVESELSHLDCHMSQSRVSPKKMSRAQPCCEIYRIWRFLLIAHCVQ